LKDGFASSREILVEVFWHRRRPGRTSQGFFTTLAARSDSLLREVTQHLRVVVASIARGRGQWNSHGLAAFGVDGTRVECPRTRVNEQALGRAGREKTGPQLQLTALRHLGSGLLWNWRIGPGATAERVHLDEMLGTLPSGALLVADAGFTGYDLFRAVLEGGRHLLIRVGSNVRLIEGLRPDPRDRHVVDLWPKEARDDGQPPLRLRLLKIREDHQVIYLVTDLSAKQLPRAQARKFYRQRWGLEVGFRTLKQTMGHRRMRSRSPRRATIELHWAMVALSLIEAMGRQAQARRRRVSPADVQRVLQTAMRRARRRCRRGWLRRSIARAVIDSYHRHGSKDSRNYPRKKTSKPPGPPKLRPPTTQEVQQYQALQRAISKEHFAA
jgi:hypothetical protein